ncbi:MAG: hypothetical protein PHD06_01195 [Bacteroidales bacterium]|nr:hypothetical protein [Bacteroidales bacterium]MDD4383772.1 hypothetical protein [Bacteroidales bacterium]
MRLVIGRLNSLAFIVLTLTLLLFIFLLIPKFGVNPLQEDIKLLDIRFWYTPIDAFHLFSQLGVDGRDAYRFFTVSIDLLYPLVYGFWFYYSLGFMLKKTCPPKTKLKTLRLIPFGIVLFDYIENLNILHLLYTFPQINEISVHIGAIATFSKWIFTILTILILIIAILTVCAKSISTLKTKIL